MPLIAAFLITAVLGAATGWVMRKYQPGPVPMDLFWSLTVGAIGALVIAGLGAWIGLYPMGGLMTYPSAITGAVIALYIYNIVITEE